MLRRRTALLAGLLFIILCAACHGLDLPASGAAKTSPAPRRLQLSDQTLSLETVYEDDFSKDSGFSKDTGDWLAEGSAKVAVRDGRLHFDATQGKRTAATIWLKKEFQGDAVIEYTARVEKGEGLTNINFFVYGSNPDGSSVLATGPERTGAYPEYHKLNNYIYTYLNEVPEKDGKSDPPERARVRFRRDPGFRLLAETWRDPIEKGRDYLFTIVIQGPRMRFYVDGELLFDHEEKGETPHRSGRHAFRTFRSHVSADLFRLSRIVPSAKRGAAD